MKGLSIYLAVFVFVTANGFAESLPQIDNQPHFPPSKRRLLPLYDKNIVDAYRAIGSRNPKWDKDAETALTIYSRYLLGQQTVFGTTNHTWMINCFSNAIAAGCDDSLIQYAAVRMRREDVYISKQPEIDVYKKVFAGLEKHPYPAIRQCLMYQRGADFLLTKNPTTTEDKEQAKKWLEIAARKIPAAINDGADHYDVYHVTADILRLYKEITGDRKLLFDALQVNMDKSVTNKTVVPLGIAGSFYIDWAWDGRGTGLGYTVTENGWKLFEERLKKAREVLERAWKQDPTDAYLCRMMLNVAAGQSSKEEFDLWFARGKKADPTHYELYVCRLHFLQPQWLGSKQEMLEFGRECVATGLWEDLIPFILMAAHQKCEHAGYYKQPEVWNEVESLYQTYLKKFPKNNVQKSAYCNYAIKAEKWDVAKRLMDELGDFATYYGFEGRLAACREEIKKHTAPHTRQK